MFREGWGDFGGAAQLYVVPHRIKNSMGGAPQPRTSSAPTWAPLDSMSSLTYIAAIG